MKTTLKAKIIIETDKYGGFGDDRGDKTELTLAIIKREINQGHYIIEWINSEYMREPEPTVIIKI